MPVSVRVKWFESNDGRKVVSKILLVFLLNDKKIGCIQRSQVFTILKIVDIYFR